MLQKIFVATATLCISLGVEAQIAMTNTTPPGTPAAEPAVANPPETDKPPFVVFSGSADVYYRYDFDKTKANKLTSFTNSHNAFSLGMASLKAQHKAGKVEAVIDLGFGQRATEFSYNDEGILAAVKQLYIGYSPKDWLKFTAGTWATHVGYELVDPQLNRNYSMSYMFTNGPFTHTGLKAEVTKGKHGLMLGISNATDYRTPPDGQINRKFLLAQYTYTASEKVKVYLNYVGGKAPDSSLVNQFDVVLTAKLSDKFNAGFNGTLNQTKAWDGKKNGAAASWWGSALYLNVDPQPWLGVTLRTEYFNDEKQLKMFSGAAKGGSIIAATLSANFKVQGFTFIPEFRLDNASQEIFTGKNGSAKKSASSFVLAAVYAF